MYCYKLSNVNSIYLDFVQVAATPTIILVGIASSCSSEPRGPCSLVAAHYLRNIVRSSERNPSPSSARLLCFAHFIIYGDRNEPEGTAYDRVYQDCALHLATAISFSRLPLNLIRPLICPPYIAPLSPRLKAGLYIMI